MKTLRLQPALVRWKRDSLFRRSAALVGVIFVISVLALAVVIICGMIFFASSANFSDRLTEVGDVVAGFTFMLTVVAAIVALRAYAVSTGPPRLRMQLDFPFSDLNKPSFTATFEENGIVRAEDFKQLACAVRIRNDANYSARNPAVVIRLHDMAFFPDYESLKGTGWVAIEFVTTYGVTIVQWDGGSDYSIHGNSVRRLPDLALYKLHTSPNPDPCLEIDILADGYNRHIIVPVEFKSGTPASSADKYATSQWI